MGPALFVIAILGCGEGDSPCEQVRRLDAHYESQAACVEATGAAMEANASLDYPVVVAQCVSADLPTAGRIVPGEVRLPGATAPSRNAGLKPKPRRG